jgi:hypothetical protein
MKVSYGIFPNCSEAVFRFYTLDVKKAKKILKAFVKVCCPDFKLPKIEKIEDIDGVSFPASNLDGEVFLEPKRGAFVVRVGNNDISDNGDIIIDTVKKLDILVEEAETSPNLERKYARDCTCGITFFDGYPKRLVRVRDSG